MRDAAPRGVRFLWRGSQIDVWRGAQRRLAAYLDGISIADLADSQGLSARLAAARERVKED